MNKSFFLLLVTLFTLSCSGDEEIVEPEPQKKFEFSGNWLGQWSDSLFPSIAISARVSKISGNSYSGSFYYDNMGLGPFKPCCGGQDNDGVISFDLDGDRVLNFKYIQVAPNYRGGCPGTYTGSGALTNDGLKLIINFTGNDCDGFHDKGIMTWALED